MADILHQWLSSLSPNQIAAVQSAASAQDLPIPTMNRENVDNLAQSHGHGQGGIAKSKKIMAVGKNAKGKNTRPLNSFMGFRCYYSVLFEDFEQKIISGYIVFLWERDPCKAKWAIAAKAYSVIRDQVGKEHAPLDVFLMLVAKPLGIVEPQAYLAVMGWEISVNEVGNVSLVKNDAMKIESSILSTNVSVEDMIGYACQHGYAGAIGSIVAAPTDKPMMAMAASEQPHSGKILENEDKNDHNGTQDIATIANASVQADDKHEEATAVTHQHDNLTAVSPSTQNTAATTVAQPSAANLMPMMAATNDFDSTSPFDIGNILDFDPEANLPFYAPSVGDEWDAFDISAWIHEDAYIN